MGATRPTAFFFFDFLPPAEDVEAEERDADDFFAFLSFFFFLAIRRDGDGVAAGFKLQYARGAARSFVNNSNLNLTRRLNTLLGHPSTQYLGTYLAGRLSTGRHL